MQVGALHEDLNCIRNKYIDSLLKRCANAEMYYRRAIAKRDDLTASFQKECQSHKVTRKLLIQSKRKVADLKAKIFENNMKYSDLVLASAKTEKNYKALKKQFAQLFDANPLLPSTNVSSQPKSPQTPPRETNGTTKKVTSTPARTKPSVHHVCMID